MSKLLTKQEHEALKNQHRSERDKRICDRIKAVLLYDQGWKPKRIAQALLLDEDTIRRHIKDYIESHKLGPENGGSSSKLSIDQSVALERHLEQFTYTKVQDICEYVFQEFSVSYTVSGMHSWLNKHSFSYKKPKGVPKKADEQAQRDFIHHYEDLLNEVDEDEPILFIDAVHPTQATRLSYGWIKKGKNKLIATSASRTRVNIIGALNLETMALHSSHVDTVNNVSIIEFFKKVERAYASSPAIHIILDQAGYHRAEEVKDYEKNSRIQLHYLPPYSPNLNPIERVWKVMHENVSNNRYFSSAKEFRQSIAEFFDQTFPKIAGSLVDRINDNFQIVKPASSI